MKQLSILFIILLLTGCSSSRPVLYPDDQAGHGGQQAINSAIDACKASARKAGISKTSFQGERTATNTAKGAAVGAVSGLVGGAISGGLGIGAAIGAASGATAGLLSSLFSVDEPNPTYQNFVNRCLQDKGYQVLGWE